jgi:two-component system sensor histidine kinase RegB
MSTEALEHLHPRRNVRLSTLVGLRWISVAGQTAAVLAVHFGFGFELPLGECLTVIGLSAWLNVALRIHSRTTQRLEPSSAAWLLAYDIAQLAVLLFLTGGLQNPFAFMLVGPVLIAATALPPRMTLMLGAFAVVCATVLVFYHFPLPWSGDDSLRLPQLYMAGIWLSILLAILSIGFYAYQVAEGARLLGGALAATELALAREQHLSQLDGLAAAAAHELGTPLSTITVIARELERALEPGSPHADDVKLLREQAQRCREILGKLTQLSTGEPFSHTKLSVLIEEVVAPHRNFDIAIEVMLPPGGTDEPLAARNPALIYGLGNLVENAVDFATARVEVAVRWSEQDVAVIISDDGPGFSPEVMARIGEPYVTSRGRPAGPESAGTESAGLGLGFFIAKTLLERSGATVDFANRPAPDKGAVVRIRWPRTDFDEMGGPPGLLTAS